MAITRLGGANAITGTLPAANINDTSIGNITALPAGVGGKVLQVVTATDGTERQTTSTSFVTASNTLSVNITPSATSSKIFVIISTSLYSQTTNKSAYITIYRDSTNLGNAQGLIRFLDQGNTGGGAGTCSVLDSPSSSSQITYQAYIRADSSSGGANLNANTKGTITAFEIAG